MFPPPVLTTPLLKVPLVLSGAVLVHISATPPTESPKPHEASRFQEDADTLSQHSRSSALFFKATVWLGALSETALILAERYYPAPLSARILSSLPDPYAPDRLRTSAPFLLGWLLICAGSALRLAAHRGIGRLFTWKPAPRDAHTLETAGPYAVVRHPGRTAMLTVMLGNLVCTFAPGSVWRECLLGSWAGRAVAACGVVTAAMTAATLVKRTEKEDEALKAAFGAEWEEWAKTTPYRLVPFVY
ncbi:hypothetical protein OBBRIDRAFT_773693 [Obba rivulosa]|uniref:Protein-S-isoprenylcysteine O-methyltransferase n=1 Tax=Obba rivulosa TaxID=1052685 RepID=A0A8E2DN74_9APHY|nr:hypothetical protein OBBRIDRAFT_773693 [Obba rivulosa]